MQLKHPHDDDSRNMPSSPITPVETLEEDVQHRHLGLHRVSVAVLNDLLPHALTKSRRSVVEAHGAVCRIMGSV